MRTTAADHEDALLGRSLEGRYRVLQRIASGGMSTVYTALDERLDRLVAVKVMSAALSADPNFSDRFAREARAAARLTHLNAVSVYDQGFDRSPDGHHVFLVMELVDGWTLRDLIRERGRLTPAETVSIMEPVLAALAAAHRAGIVHRDIKPENILISDDGIVKVADFGLARAMEADAAATRTGLLMGTVAYCAPETISQGVADPRSDVYSAAVVLFELLTGTQPYRGESAMNVAYQHVNSRVPAPSSRVRGLPEQLDELVVAAADSDPDGRPADAGAFLAEIADARTALRLPVVPVPAAPRKTHRPQPVTGAAARHDDNTTSLIDSGSRGRHDTTVVPGSPRPGGATAGSRSAGEEAPPPPVVIPPTDRRRRQRRRRWIVVLIVLIVGLAAAGGGWWLATRYFRYVPKTVGLTQAAATRAVSDAGYAVRVDPGPVSSESVPAGSVVASDPSAGQRLTRGDTVTITISAGPRTYTIPVLTNLTEQQARAKLSAVGPVTVAANVKPESSETVKSGLVTRTDPPAGRTVNARQTITLYLSTGPPLVPVPTIGAGTSVADAKATLAQAGFPTVDTDSQVFSDTVPDGAVVGCSPAGGTAVKGSTVRCTLSKGPEYVTIPDFGSLTPLDDVRKQLTDLGLKVHVEKAFGGYSGRVVGIAPASGQRVRVGSTVVVTIV